MGFDAEEFGKFLAIMDHFEQEKLLVAERMNSYRFMYSQLDTNHDGKISMEEFTKGEEKSESWKALWSKFDQTGAGDGLFNLEQMIRFYEAAGHLEHEEKKKDEL